MFEILPASATRAATSPSSALLSAAVHGALIAAALLLTARATVPPTIRQAVDPVIFIPLATRTPRQPVPPPLQTSAPRPPGPMQGPLPSPILVPGIPLPPVPGPAPIPTTQGTLPTGSGVEAAWLDSPTAGEAWSATQVDEPAEVVEPGRLRYPPALERAGVSGTVIVEFVVDTAGQAERAGLRVVSSTRSEFESAAMEAVLGTRFRSAQVRGSAVRQLVRQRLSFVAP